MYTGCIRGALDADGCSRFESRSCDTVYRFRSNAPFPPPVSYSNFTYTTTFLASPLAHASIFPATVPLNFSIELRAHQAICGLNTSLPLNFPISPFESLHSLALLTKTLFPVPAGSSKNTSVAAPPIFPSSKAFTSASSSTIPPLATFTINASGRMSENSGVESRFVVEGVRGRVRKSRVDWRRMVVKGR
jgi:hypothetical protein